ncbi:hypothetical protein QN277_002421 [Acacia crassicarpa]|uniref:VQ domain-containing protein n=1 Tax=Acacia crassicarpa TaxID=499986 RepID=A0AAE1TI38_9FABA|nr:hypothetical protein QN277_002421 [Acacia crassicarpa]
MSGRAHGKEPVKVVIISTKHVQTDAGSFKSVVQKLTGKDSQHEDEEEAEDSSRKQGSVILEAKAQSHHHEVSGGGSSRVFIRDLSFKEFDRMFREMPPIHEIWSDDYNQ